MSVTNNTITELTTCARRALGEFRQQISSRSNSTQPCDRLRLEEAVRSVYRAADYSPPAFIWCDSPGELALMPLALESLLVPSRRTAVQFLLGEELLDGLLVKVCSQYHDSAFDAYETLLHPNDDRRRRQLDLMRSLNRALRKNTLKRLDWKYHSAIGPDARSEIAQQLQGPLLRDFLLRTHGLYTAMTQRLNQSLSLPDRFRMSQRRWRPPQTAEIQSYLALLGTDGDPRRMGDIPFPAGAIAEELRSDRWLARWVSDAESILRSRGATATLRSRYRQISLRLSRPSHGRLD